LQDLEIKNEALVINVAVIYLDLCNVKGLEKFQFLGKVVKITVKHDSLDIVLLRGIFSQSNAKQVDIIVESGYYETQEMIDFMRTRYARESVNDSRRAS
jgi:hypothetical protein